MCFFDIKPSEDKAGKILQNDPLKGRQDMLIHVQLTGGHYDYVSPEILDEKILTGEVVKFSRSTGWVVVGKDPIRENHMDRRYYLGPERRYPTN